jgi:hypothetical protein
MWLKMTAGQIHPSSVGTCTPPSDYSGRIHCPDMSKTIFATFSAPIAKKGKITQK